MFSYNYVSYNCKFNQLDILSLKKYAFIIFQKLKKIQILFSFIFVFLIIISKSSAETNVTHIFPQSGVNTNNACSVTIFGKGFSGTLLQNWLKTVIQ